MSNWVKLCTAAQSPADGHAQEVDVQGVTICLARADGTLAAVDNVCPHRAGPLAEGWIEDGKIVCPWHAWGFDLKTGACPEEHSQVKVYPLREEGTDLLIDLA
ncbi:hypothetical protein GCM10022270_25800 [Terriglobus aquaticus]